MDVSYTAGDPNVSIDIDPNDSTTYDVVDIPPGTDRLRVRVTAGGCPKVDDGARPDGPVVAPVGGADHAAQVTGPVIVSGSPAGSDVVALIAQPSHPLWERDPTDSYLLQFDVTRFGRVDLPFTPVRGRLLGPGGEGRLLIGVEVDTTSAIQVGDDYVIGIAFGQTGPDL